MLANQQCCNLVSQQGLNSSWCRGRKSTVNPNQTCHPELLPVDLIYTALSQRKDGVLVPDRKRSPFSACAVIRSNSIEIRDDIGQRATIQDGACSCTVEGISSNNWIGLRSGRILLAPQDIERSREVSAQR